MKATGVRRMGGRPGGGGGGGLCNLLLAILGGVSARDATLSDPNPPPSRRRAEAETVDATHWLGGPSNHDQNQGLIDHQCTLPHPPSLLLHAVMRLVGRAHCLSHLHYIMCNSACPWASVPSPKCNKLL